MYSDKHRLFPCNITKRCTFFSESNIRKYYTLDVIITTHPIFSVCHKLVSHYIFSDTLTITFQIRINIMMRHPSVINTILFINKSRSFSYGNAIIFQWLFTYFLTPKPSYFPETLMCKPHYGKTIGRKEIVRCNLFVYAHIVICIKKTVCKPRNFIQKFLYQRRIETWQTLWRHDFCQVDNIDFRIRHIKPSWLLIVCHDKYFPYPRCILLN